MATPADSEVAQATPAPSKSGVKAKPIPMKGADSAAKKKSRWLGLSVANMTDPIPGAPEDRRGIVSRAFRGGPAHRAGLRRGDVLLVAGESKVLKYQDYLAEARKVEVGGHLPVTILRNGKEMPVTIEMIEKPKDIRRWKLENWKGTDMPPYEAPLLRPAGKTATSETSRGKVRVLYFWATWCGPCRQTAPLLDQLYTEVGPTKLELLAVSSEERGVLDKYLEKSKTTFPIAHDAQGHLKLDFEVKKLPTILVVDADGTVVSWDTSVSGVKRAIQTVRTLLSS